MTNFPVAWSSQKAPLEAWPEVEDGGAVLEGDAEELGAAVGGEDDFVTQGGGHLVDWRGSGLVCGVGADDGVVAHRPSTEETGAGGVALEIHHSLRKMPLAAGVSSGADG